MCRILNFDDANNEEGSHSKNLPTIRLKSGHLE
jgi:hypothetical protein